MNTLATRIARLIEATGPISLAEYMHLCMADPAEGYYARRPAIGADGDFITAPEVSQMFGELIGIWCAGAWIAAGRPSSFALVEMGPGRGTLMADLIRATARIDGFLAAAKLHLVETSPALRAAQAQRLAGMPVTPRWVDALDAIPRQPLLLVANEFLDVLPVRQYVKADGHWREICIGLDDGHRLRRVLGTRLLDPAMLPSGHGDEPTGAVFEHAPAREAWLTGLAGRLASDGGSALLFDYGHAASGFGETFQAMRAHRPCDPLEDPGAADLTAHVDFAALDRHARQAGATVAPIVTQGEFLIAMGLAERAGRLGAGRSETEQAQIRLAAERLVLPEQMGSLFKVMALHGGVWQAAMEQLPPWQGS